MPRYFYTDPRKAAWMAREYEVKFISSCANDTLDWNNDFCEVSPRGWNCSKFYIHPDSLHILERQAGDEMLNIIPTFDIYSDSEIVKRDGKAFFMPEVECATSS